MFRHQPRPGHSGALSESRLLDVEQGSTAQLDDLRGGRDLVDLWNHLQHGAVLLDDRRHRRSLLRLCHLGESRLSLAYGTSGFPPLRPHLTSSPERHIDRFSCFCSTRGTSTGRCHLGEWRLEDLDSHLIHAQFR